MGTAWQRKLAACNARCVGESCDCVRTGEWAAGMAGDVFHKGKCQAGQLRKDVAHLASLCGGGKHLVIVVSNGIGTLATAAGAAFPNVVPSGCFG